MNRTQGRPATFTPEQVGAIVALACEPLEKSELPLSHWSQSELAREAVRRGIVDDAADLTPNENLSRIAARGIVGSVAFDANREQDESAGWCESARLTWRGKPRKHEDPPRGRAGVPANRGISSLWQARSSPKI